MNTEELLYHIAKTQQTKQLIEYTKQGINAQLTGISSSFRAFQVASFFLASKSNHVIVLPEKEEAAYFYNDLQAVLPHSAVYFLPDSFRKINQFQSVDHQSIRLRTEVIKAIAQNQSTFCIITYPEALIETIPDVKTVNSRSINIRVNQQVSLDRLLDQFIDLGFERTDFVYEPGQFSLRGGIVDIFSYGSDKPYRIELFGDDVESIRLFDPLTQSSIKAIQDIQMIPNLQYEQSKTQPFFSAMPKNTTIWGSNFSFIEELIHRSQTSFEEFTIQNIELEANHPLYQSSTLFFSTAQKIIESMHQFSRFEMHNTSEDNHNVTYKLSHQPLFQRNFQFLATHLDEYTAKGYQFYLASTNEKQHERFRHIFKDLRSQTQFKSLPVDIHEGFINHELKLAVYTDHQIFERYHKYKLNKGYTKAEAINVKTIMELLPGDYITHIDHGIGKFSGLQTLEVNGKTQEAVRLVFKNNDLLYVNINSLYKIAKYSSKDGKQPVLSKLGSDTWQKLKNKTKKKVKDIAHDLIELYAKRKSSKGFAYSPDTYLQLELESSFMYEDTPDQASTILAVKEDMEKTYPMDRLVCGDVGFGKTEIAIRAAFKAVADGKQVAVLVPTTILALQHYKTFSKRLEDFPCTVDYINRFKTTKQKKETLERLKDGKVDILIGTHAIASKQVVFKDLGLLIIDEEQKFGVSVKEKLRQIKANVDTLTLTATPIPRTLQFSLMGARDLSIMRTPPPNRQPIYTEVKVFNETILKEAIEYEIYRGGQVFFVHNRVQGIYEYADLLQRIMPEIKIGVAHGQLEGKQLEQKLMEFINQNIDVLLCTNIVEAGLDIPNANTMIINNAHQFGLSDLHQLRGRVGRSNKKAFCYLFAPPLSTMSSDSRKRLETLEQFNELGSGFQIAMRDLDIRGAGNILGAEQSGFVSEIGLNTFHKVLDEAVRELKQTDFKDLFKEEFEQGNLQHVSDCQIDMDIELLIPNDYVNSVSERMLLYQQLNECRTEAELQAFAHLLKDRFGTIPSQVHELFDALRLQWLAKTIGFERILLKNNTMRCFFIQNQDSAYFESKQFSQILAYIQAHPSACKLKQTAKNLSLSFAEINHSKQALQKLRELSTFAY